MSYDLSTVLHLFGGFLLFTSFGAMIYHQLHTGDAVSASRDKARRLAGASHGIALVILFASGLLLVWHLTRIRVIDGYPWPLWVWLKMALWLLMGALIAIIRRAPHLAKALWWGVPLLGGVAAFLAIYKPGG
ncbi:MAG: hypothetical protein AAF604_06655 [Acidobacteriota bacterium]